MGMKLFNDTSAYMKDVTNLIWNYIRHRDLYPENAQLAVQPEIMANVIDDPSQCRFCDFYDLNTLIVKDVAGRQMPNKHAIQNMANRYFQVG
jgi:hypothetical protein